MKRVSQVVAGALLMVASGCGPRDLIGLGREPTMADLAWFLLLAPVWFVARFFVETLAGEALGMLVGRFVPAWMKTRRAIWTGVALLCLLTLAAVAYWNLAGPA